MLYELAHTIQNRTPWLWKGIEDINSVLFSLRLMGKKDAMKAIMVGGVRMAEEDDAERLAQFFAEQPEDSFKWFKPHAFDVETMRTLLRQKSYIIYVMEQESVLMGYAFLRCFIHGKCFLGKMVDYRYQGKGVCTKLCAVGMDISILLGLRMYESINKENIGSMKASQRACDVIVVEELEGGDVLIEDRQKGSLNK